MYLNILQVNLRLDPEGNRMRFRAAFQYFYNKIISGQMKPEEAILIAKTIMDDSKKPAKLMKGSRALPAIGIPALGITIPGAAIAAVALLEVDSV